MENIKLYTPNTNLEVLNIDGIECYEVDGVAYLKLETVARGLGFTQIAKSGNEVVRWERVNKYLDEIGVPTCGDDGFIPENIFYRLAMKAKNKAAETFQKKIADEVIPSIRKYGTYMTPETVEKAFINPDFLIGVLTALKKEQAHNKELEAKIEADKDKVDLAEQCMIANNSIKVGDFCKLLYEKEHLEIGRDRLFKFLREHKVLQENNVPYQAYMERDWFDVIEYTLYHSGEAAIYPSTRITPKGQAGILKMLRKFYVKSK